jgi:hypothetical protein
MSITDLQVFWDALMRIIEGAPIRVKKGLPITFDLVCLEAGRSRGSLKANRPHHQPIREAILSAANAHIQKTPKKASKRSWREATKAKNEEIEFLKRQYDLVLNREIMLIQHIDTLEKEIVELKTQRRGLYLVQ